MQFDILASRLRELSFLNAGFVITLTDERGGGREPRHFEYKGGIREFVEHLNKTKEPVHDKVVSHHRRAARSRAAPRPIGVEVALQWNSTYSEQIFCYTNNVHNKDGGTHLTGSPRGAHQGVQHLRHRAEPLQGGEERALTGEDMREGLTAVISVKHPDPSLRLADQVASSSRAR